MWHTIVSTGDAALRHLQVGFSEQVVRHPILVMSMAALGMGLVVTIWAETRMRQLGILQARVTDGGVPAWLRR